MTALVQSLVADPAYRQLKDQVLASTGLAYYTDKDEDFSRRVTRRLERLALKDCGAYLRVLRHPTEGPAELEHLVAEITIGETYFFRHREHFEAIRDIVIAQRLVDNSTRRTLRIWCAGCADGAEPYSLSILLKRELGTQLLGWDLSILATDINRHALRAAREGRFEEWSLRATTDEIRDACFRPDGKRWILEQEPRAGVTFQYHNLVEDPFPAGPFDLIICRNVMIYFDASTMRRLADQFYDALAPRGWLLVGPSEPNMTCFTSFAIVNAPGTTLYQKPALPNSHGTIEPRPSGGGDTPYLEQPLPETPGPQAAAPAAELTLADVRRHQDLGDSHAAAESCLRLIEGNSLDPQVHFHHALALERLGKNSEAEWSLRRAIYLDRKSVLPHYHLGLLLESSGQLRPAGRAFENALTLLAGYAPGHVFRDAGGITAAELSRRVRRHASVLQESA